MQLRSQTEKCGKSSVPYQKMCFYVLSSHLSPHPHKHGQSGQEYQMLYLLFFYQPAVKKKKKNRKSHMTKETDFSFLFQVSNQYPPLN